MENKAVRNLFIFGSIFFFAIFVGLTYDTMKKHDSRVPPITDGVNEGKMLWHKYDCIGCHTILGNGSYFAPDLTKITVNKPKGYLEKFLENPREVKPKAAMPDMGITAEEAAKIVVFLEWMSKVDTNGWPPEPVLASMLKAQTGGVALYQKNGCTACHMIGGVGGTSGPDLSGVGSRRPDVDWHIGHLKNPSAKAPNSAMPAYAGIPEEELRGLAEYMVSLKQGVR